MPILRMSTAFAQSANDLPNEEKVKLPKILMLLTDNPQHPSLQFQKVNGAHRANIYECRLDKSWRIILQRTGEMNFDLIYVGPHDKALRYGSSLREAYTRYGGNVDLADSVGAYLSGCDDAIEFVAFSEAELQKWGIVQNV